MLSSISQRPAAELMDELKFAAFLNKPIKASQLFKVLRMSLGMETDADEVEIESIFDSDLAIRQPLSILIAEDNVINQKVVQRLLQKFGYRSDVVVNGVEVLDALDRQRYDLLLLDLQMPEMDGLEAARRITERLPKDERPRIVAMTANVQPSDRAACLSVGMDDFLAKPVELHQLRCILEFTKANKKTNRKLVENTLSADIDMERIEMIQMTQDDEDPNLLTSIIDMFLIEADERLTSILAANTNLDRATLEMDVHRFYSSCSNLGLIRMSALCTEIEQRAPECGSDNIQELISELIKAYEEIQPDLVSLKSSGSTVSREKTL